MKLFAVIVVVSAAAASGAAGPLALAQDKSAAAAPASAGSDWVTYKSGSEDVKGFLALPKSAGKHPAIVVIQEWWGVNDWVKEQAFKLAGEGYVALAADLYRGKVATDPGIAHEMTRGLPEDRALRDLNGAVEYLRARPDVNPDAIGSIGWDMGGGYSLSLAVANPRVKACVINYGRLLTDEATLAKLHAAVLGSFGSDDASIPPDAVKEFESKLKKLGRSVDVKIYEGAGHAFENETNNKKGYKPEAAKDAWERTIAFLKKTL